MKDIMGMMKAAQEMQAKMQGLQQEIGGGMVVVTLSGKGEMRGIKIDPSLVSDDVSVLEDLIIAAHNDAKVKADTSANAKMQELTAGLPLPPGMKLPF